MPTVAVPADAERETVEITGLARAMMDNGMDETVIGTYLANKDKDRNVDSLLRLLDS